MWLYAASWKVTHVFNQDALEDVEVWEYLSRIWASTAASNVAGEAAAESAADMEPRRECGKLGPEEPTTARDAAAGIAEV